MLAHILVSKFDDHLPLYRQNEIFARMGADIPDATLVNWCGGAMKTLGPLIERIEADIMASDLLHADDTPIRVLDRSRRDRGLGKGVYFISIKRSDQRRLMADVIERRDEFMQEWERIHGQPD